MKKRYWLLLIDMLLPYHLFAFDVDVRQMGAVNDGIFNNAAIIQKAIDECSQEGGGTVLLAGGGKYMSGTLFLRSNVTFRIDNGTTLLASPNIDDYAVGTTYKTNCKQEKHMDRCFIFAEGCSSIVLDGYGTIDGNGYRTNFKEQRPMMIRIKDCERVTLKDLTLKNPAAWTSAWLYCHHITVSNVCIISGVNYNGDGLDFDCSSDIHVNNCSFDTSDDCICLHSSRPDKFCGNVTVSNCSFTSKCAGMRIGLLSRGEISDVAVSNCVFRDCNDSGLKIQQNEGGFMSDMTFSNLVMKNVPRPVFMTFCKQRACADVPQDKLDSLQYMKRMNFSDFIINDEALDKNVVFVISGIPGHYIEDISFRNIYFYLAGGGTQTDAERKDIPEFDLASMKEWWPEYYCFKGPLPTSGFYIRHAKNIHLSDITVHSKNVEKRPIMKFVDVQMKTISNVKKLIEAKTNQ